MLTRLFRRNLNYSEVHARQMGCVAGAFVMCMGTPPGQFSARFWACWFGTIVALAIVLPLYFEFRSTWRREC